MPVLPYGPPNVRLIRPKRLPQGVRDAGVALVERKLSNSTVKDLVSISDDDWLVACRRFNATQQLAKHRGRLQARVASIAKMLGVTDRTVRRWLAIYRKNPDIVALLPKPRGQKVGTRRLGPDIERLLNDVIDVWAAKAEHLPVAWILEECKRRTRTARLSMPSRRAIDARLRDRGLDGLSRRQFAPKADAAVVLTPRSRKALAIVQMDHTLVDIMVVDEVLRQSMGRPWITVAFDIATRVVLGFALRLEPPSATSVGLALAMACLSKDQWLKDRHLDLDWAPFGVPALIHVDNGKEFHSLALTRGCERYGISLEYRPPGRPQFGGHIERYLGTLMRRIHGLPGDQRAALNAIKFLANKLRISIVAAGTHEALHVMRADPQIASRFEQLELPVWTESQELRRFIAGYLALLPIKRSSAAIDKRFVEYLLELSEGVTGRIIDVLRRAALQGIADKTQKVGLVQLQVVGAKMPSVVGQRA